MYQFYHYLPFTILQFTFQHFTNFLNLNTLCSYCKTPPACYLFFHSKPSSSRVYSGDIDKGWISATPLRVEVLTITSGFAITSALCPTSLAEISPSSVLPIAQKWKRNETQTSFVARGNYTRSQSRKLVSLSLSLSPSDTLMCASVLLYRRGSRAISRAKWQASVLVTPWGLTESGNSKITGLSILFIQTCATLADLNTYWNSYV